MGVSDKPCRLAKARNLVHTTPPMSHLSDAREQELSQAILGGEPDTCIFREMCVWVETCSAFATICMEQSGNGMGTDRRTLGKLEGNPEGLPE